MGCVLKHLVYLENGLGRHRGCLDLDLFALPGCELFDLLKKRGRIREFDDPYFISLLAYSDLTISVSYDDHLSTRLIQFLRIFGMVSLLRDSAI